jgi:hypothetical protein
MLTGLDRPLACKFTVASPPSQREKFYGHEATKNSSKCDDSVRLIWSSEQFHVKAQIAYLTCKINAKTNFEKKNFFVQLMYSLGYLFKSSTAKTIFQNLQFLTISFLRFSFL